MSLRRAAHRQEEQPATDVWSQARLTEMCSAICNDVGGVTVLRSLLRLLVGVHGDRHADEVAYRSALCQAICKVEAFGKNEENAHWLCETFLENPNDLYAGLFAEAKNPDNLPSTLPPMHYAMPKAKKKAVPKPCTDPETAWRALPKEIHDRIRKALGKESNPFPIKPSALRSLETKEKNLAAQVASILIIHSLQAATITKLTGLQLPAVHKLIYEANIHSHTDMARVHERLVAAIAAWRETKQKQIPQKVRLLLVAYCAMQSAAGLTSRERLGKAYGFNPKTLTIWCNQHRGTRPETLIAEALGNQRESV